PGWRLPGEAVWGGLGLGRWFGLRFWRGRLGFLELRLRGFGLHRGLGGLGSWPSRDGLARAVARDRLAHALAPAARPAPTEVVQTLAGVAGELLAADGAGSGLDRGAGAGSPRLRCRGCGLGCLLPVRGF